MTTSKLFVPAVAMFVVLMSGCNSNDFEATRAAAEAYQVKVNEAGAPDASDSSGSDDGSGTNDKLEGEEQIDGKDCAEVAGLSLQKVKIAGSDKNIVLNDGQALALRVTGNNNTAGINLKDAGVTTEVKALCLFIAGNQNKVDIDVGNHIGAIVVRARGNAPLITVRTFEGAVIDKIEMDSKGNGGALKLSGAGKFPCDSENKAITCN